MQWKNCPFLDDGVIYVIYIIGFSEMYYVYKKSVTRR